MEILIATTNKGKIEEIRTILSSFPALTILTPPDLGIDLDVAETGSTYRENAAIKAEAFFKASGIACLADDSGLEVQALGGEPGLFSARYCPKPDATDADRRHYLLEKLQAYPQPWTARFLCVVALAFAGQPIQTVQGECAGVIIPQERGTNGFGYDPIFYMPEYRRTMAELPAEKKNRISHRGRAIQAAGRVLAAL